MEKPLTIVRKALAATLLATLFAIITWVSVPPGEYSLHGWAGQSPDLPITRSHDLQGAYRFDQGGWVFIHLQGSPRQIGYQHGYLLAPEILDAFQAVRLRD